MIRAPFCPDPHAVPAVPDITQLPDEAAVQAQREAEDAARRADEKRWDESVQGVDRATGEAAFLRDYEKSDPQQRAFIDAIAESYQPGFRVLQGVAAAGSGKTRCVVLGIAKLFYSGKMPPTRIVCTTFTKKSSRELIERLCRYIPKHSVLTQLRVGTFHSGRVSGQGLRNAGRARTGKLVTDLTPYLRPILDRPKGNDPNPTVLNVAGVAPRNLAEALGGVSKAAKSYSDVITNKFEPWGMRSPQQVRQYLAGVQKQGVASLTREERERYTAIVKAKDLSSDDDVYPQFPAIWADALKVKEARREFTYNDLLGDYLDIAERDPVGLFVVDESQDNSWVQLQIALRCARAGNGTLVLVGDGRQGIYRFRGADPTIFQFAATDFGAIKAEIGTNYRSGYWIVEAGNVVCLEPGTGKQAAWAIGEPAVAGRVTGDGAPFQGEVKVGHYAKGTGLVPIDGVQPAREEKDRKKKWKPISGEVPAARAIAELLAEDCVTHPDGTLTLRHGTAIITRTNAPLGAFELALSRYRIPCAFAGGKGNFMTSGPVRSMLRLLALASGVVEDPELAGRLLHKILRDPGGRWWGDRFKYMKNEDFFQTVRDNWHNGLLRCIEAFGRDRKRRQAAEDFAADVEPLCTAEWADAPSIASDIMRGWEELNTKKQDDEEEGEEVDEDAVDDDPSDSYYQSLADIAATFESYADFMVYVAKASSTASVGEGEKKEGAVMLTTAHRSKGLEWHTVHLVAPHGVWPHSKASSDREQEEERRLYYVGVTRAADVLYVHSYGESASPFTFEVFHENILPRMQKARIEAERAKRLAEVGIHPVDDGPNGAPEGFAVFRDGIRVRLGGRNVWATYDEAAEAWLTMEPDASPLADRISAFLGWLRESHPNIADGLYRRHRTLEALVADEQVAEQLGWSTLQELFPSAPSDVEVRTRGGRRVGYLLREHRGRPAVFHGYLELRAPWSDYVIRPIPGDAVLAGYGSKFVDNTFALIEARYTYAATLPARGKLGEAIPEDPITVEPHPLIEDGQTAAEAVSSLGGASDAARPPVIVPEALEATLGPPAERYEVPPTAAPRRLLPVRLPKKQELDSWSLLIVTPDGIQLGAFGLDRYTEVPLLSRSLLRHYHAGKYTIYRVAPGAVDKEGRLTGTLQEVVSGDRAALATLDFAAIGRDIADEPLRQFLSTPNIRPQDQVLWEATMNRPFKFDFGRLVDQNGNILMRVEAEDLSRLASSGWFRREQNNSGPFLWNDEALQRVYATREGG